MIQRYEVEEIGNEREKYCKDEDVKALEEKVERLGDLINNPEVNDFMKAVKLEAAHQTERWGNNHDEGKSSEDWLWLIAYLSTKASQASRYNDLEKHKHHIVTCAAACLNWHHNVTGFSGLMKPGANRPAKEK